RMGLQAFPMRRALARLGTGPRADVVALRATSAIHVNAESGRARVCASPGAVSPDCQPRCRFCIGLEAVLSNDLIVRARRAGRLLAVPACCGPEREGRQRTLTEPGSSREPAEQSHASPDAPRPVRSRAWGAGPGQSGMSVQTFALEESDRGAVKERP